MKFDYRNEKMRRKIVSEYLYGTIPKVVLLVEGESEEVAINILMGAFGKVPEQEGIAIHNFKGTGGISAHNASAVLRIAEKQNVGKYLIIDNDAKAKELVEELSERLKLSDRDCYRIWDTDFEQDNFTLDEIVDTVNRKLQTHGLNPMKISEIKARMSSHPKEKLWKAIQNVCRIKNRTALDNIISKKSLAQILSMKRANEIQQEIKENRYKPKWKIEEQINKIYNKFCM
jgi:hypothetical protein